LLALLSELTSGEDERAEAAVPKLAALGAQVLPALGELLRSPNAGERWWAVRTLAEVSDPQVPGFLEQMLEDADAGVRQCAALALRQRPAPGAIPGLLKLMGGEDILASRLAGDALIAQGEAAVPALLEIMQNGPQAVRLEAVRALARIGDQRSIPALCAALDEDSALMDYWASEGLERMGVGMILINPSTPK
jgi:HEAT repeat protein